MILVQHFVKDKNEWWWSSLRGLTKDTTVAEAIKLAYYDMDRTRLIVVPDGETCPDLSTEVPEAWVVWTYNPDDLVQL